MVQNKITSSVRFVLNFALIVSILAIGVSAYMGWSGGAAVKEVLEKQFFFLFFTIMTLLYLTVLERSLKKIGFIVDQRLISVIVLFIFAGSFLGSGLDFFQRFQWWDTMLHTLSGVILALIGFTLVSGLNDTERYGIKMNPFFVALVSFTFAVAIGALWEIVEFSIDWALGTNMQRWATAVPPHHLGRLVQGAGLLDTMKDLVVDTLGAVIVSVIGYLYLKSGRSFMSVKRKEAVSAETPETPSEVTANPET